MTDAQGGTDQPVRPSEGHSPAPGHVRGGRNLDRRWAVLAVAVALVAGVTGGVFLGRGSVDSPAAATAAAPTADADGMTGESAVPNVPQPGTVPPSGDAPTSPSAPAGPAPLREALPASDIELAPPVSITIPEIGIDQSLIELGVMPDRTLEVPSNGTDIGWWRGGPVPGEAGGAVIAAHVTYNGGQPAVFVDLPSLSAGSEVRIGREDGSVATYQVTSVEAVAKDEFPNEKIYRLEGPPVLALITCGGDFVNGSYVDNIIVYASLVADTRAGAPA